MSAPERLFLHHAYKAFWFGSEQKTSRDTKYIRADLYEQALREWDKAKRALLRAGFIDNGGEEWKPPLGKPPKE